MAVAFRASGSGVGTITTTASPVVTKPAGVVDGDLVFISFATDTTHALTATPAGWGLIGTTSVGTDSTLTVIRKRASGEPASWTFTSLFTGAQSGEYGVVAYSGSHLTTPINASATGTTTTAALKSGPSITPTVPNCMILQFGGGDPPNSSYTATPDTSPVATERFDAANSSLGWVYCQEFLQGAAAAIALDHTTSTATLTTVVMEVAIAPDTGAAAPQLPPRRRQAGGRFRPPIGARFP